MKYLTLFLSMLLVGACANASFYADAELVEVDGITFFARKLDAHNSWEAGPNEGWQKKPLRARPDLYAANIKVIEHVSGCNVVAGSTSNLNGYTTAAVECP